MKTSDDVLDYRGQRSPLPTMRLSHFARDHVGASVQVMADDDDFPEALEVWCRAAGAHIVTLKTCDEGWVEARVTLPGEGDIAPQTEGLHKPAHKNLDARGLDGPALIRALSSTARSAGETHTTIDVKGDNEVFPEVLKGWCRSRDALLHNIRAREGVYSALIELGGLEGDSIDEPLFETDDHVALDRLAIKGTAPVRRRTPRVTDLTQPIDMHSEAAPRLRATPHEAFTPAPASVGPQSQASGDPVSLSHEVLSEARAWRARRKAALRASILITREDPAAALAAFSMASESAHKGMKTLIFFTGKGVHLLIGDDAHRRRMGRSGLWRRLQRRTVPDLDSPREPSAEALRGAIARSQQAGVGFKVCKRSLATLGWRSGDLLRFPNLDLTSPEEFVEEAHGADLCLSF